MVPRQRHTQLNDASGVQDAPELRFSEHTLDEAAGYFSVGHQATGRTVTVRRGWPFLTIQRRRCSCGQVYAQCRCAQFARVWLRPKAAADA